MAKCEGFKNFKVRGEWAAPDSLKVLLYNSIISQCRGCLRHRLEKYLLNVERDLGWIV
jgi:hypothetical protein